MLRKDEVDNMVNEMKSLKARTEAAEAKVTSLEDEKTNLIAKGFVSGNRSSSDESRALRFFGVSHPKDLLKINVASERYRGVPEELKYLVLNFKKAVDVSRWSAQLFHGEPLDRSTADEDVLASGVKGMLDTRFGREILAPAIKAFGSTVSGAGDEWVPTAIASSYIEEYELEKVLEQRIRNIPMPTNPFDMPIMKNVTKARKATENTTMTEANFGTDKLTLSAVKLAEYYILPEELTEDSAPDFLAAGRDEVVKSQIRAVETAIINGDDDGTHIDTDTQALGADVAEKIWKGWRRQALANSANGSTLDFSNAAISETNLRTLRGRMGKFGSNPMNLLWVVGPSAYTQFLALPSVVTIDKFGPQATVLRGALAAYQGIPIVNSEYCREDLNATGVQDGVTTDRAIVLLVNVARWYLGNRRPIRVKLMQDLPNQDRWLLASYRRAAFIGHTQSATEKSVVYGYNIAK